MEKSLVEAAAIRDEWVAEFSIDISWEDLKERFSNDGELSEELFWRNQESPAHIGLTDDEMVEQGWLVEVPDKGIYHAVYLPWTFPDGTPGKSTWSEERWAAFSNSLSAFLKRARNRQNRFDWSELTIPGNVVDQFPRKPLKKCYLYGDVSGNSHTGFEDCIIDGNLISPPRSLSRVYITGATSYSKSTKILDSKINELKFTGPADSSAEVTIKSCVLSRLIAQGEFRRFSITDIDATLLSFTNCNIGLFELNSKDSCTLAVDFKGTVKNRASFKNIIFLQKSDNRKVSFSDSKFKDKIDFIECDIPLTLLADVQLEGPIEIRPKDSSIDKTFDRDIARIASLESAEASEISRRSLERACQIICDRHRQDGRKDMELMFRRLEVKARAKRRRADKPMKVVNWFYETTSDFGVSLLRPLASFVILGLIFFLLYLSIAAVEFDRFRIGGTLDTQFIQSVALLTLDKAFPIGVAVDETKLMNGDLIGHNGGWSAVILGMLGTVQTLLSGVLIFLFGLAVRSRLLIG